LLRFSFSSFSFLFGNDFIWFRVIRSYINIIIILLLYYYYGGRISSTNQTIPFYGSDSSVVVVFFFHFFNIEILGNFFSCVKLTNFANSNIYTHQ